MLRFLCLIVLLLAAISIRAEVPSWKAGAAKVKITPEKPMWMSGYASRDKPAEGTRQDLWAKAIVLEDTSGMRVCLVTLDLVGIPRDLSTAVCDELLKKYKLPRECVCLSVSHTHCGPVVGQNLGTMYFLDEENQKLVIAYERSLRTKIVDVVAAALDNLAPADIAWGRGQAGFAVNRRENKEADVPKLRESGQLKGPVDHDVPVLSVRDKASKLRAVVFGYACHATVLSFFQWCGDYPGFAQAALEKAHPEAVALFFAGCGADQNPLPRRKVELAEEYGQRLAAAVDDVLGAPMIAVKGKLAATYAEVPLAFGDLPSRDQLLKDAENRDKYVASRAKLMLKQMENKGSLSGTYPYPVQAWGVGSDLTLVALGGEVVVDYSLRLKKELGREGTWVMAYANDVMAYIPSLRVLKEGGYEGATAMVYYGLPTVWGPKVEETIVNTVRTQVKKVR
jgi:hypothetical protein